MSLEETSESQPESLNVCWFCGAVVTSHFCGSCNYIQPLDPNQDYFSFFQQPRRFHVDLAQLENSFYELSRKFHPDFFSNASEQEKRYSMDRSSRLNDAYRTLKDSNRRARYILQLEGIDSSSNKDKTPPDLLAEVFELNEQMQELRFAKKSGDKEEIASLKRQLEEMQQMLTARAKSLNDRLSRAFAMWESAAAETAKEALDQAQEIMMQMSYINNLIDDIEEEL